jgi:hypothetical protein
MTMTSSELFRIIAVLICASVQEENSTSEVKLLAGTQNSVLEIMIAAALRGS